MCGCTDFFLPITRYLIDYDFSRGVCSQYDYHKIKIQSCILKETRIDFFIRHWWYLQSFQYCIFGIFYITQSMLFWNRLVVNLVLISIILCNLSLYWSTKNVEYQTRFGHNMLFACQKYTTGSQQNISSVCDKMAPTSAL